MAAPKPITVLRRGADEWNAWASRHGSRQTLIGQRFGVTDTAMLNGVNLAGADLRRSYFNGIGLAGADFRDANLYGATFLGCCLYRAKFSGRETIAERCSFMGCDLGEADLSGAYLKSADFTEVNCHGATFSEARLTASNFRNANATPVMTKTDVSSYVRGLLGGPVEDLTDTEIDRLRNLCTVFLARQPDADVVAARSLALQDARLPVDEARLRNLFRADDLSDANTDYRNQLLVYIDGLKGANFGGANLTECNLSGAKFPWADFRGANLNKTVLVGTDLSHANLSGASVYGMSVWDVNLTGTIQRDLAVTRAETGQTASLSVDDIEVAQFIYLLLQGDRLRSVIDTITSKVVLILGRFTDTRKPVLDAIRTELRKPAFGYVPVVFDSSAPTSRDTHETVTLLARMSRFVIADITDAKSIPQELVSIVEQLPSLPVQPILERGCERWSMFDHIARYPWVLPIHEYQNLSDLLPSLQSVITPAEMRLGEARQP